MPESDRGFVGSIPEIYDRYLVPLIFETYATDIAKRTAALAPRAVLETAAGSGVVTRALASRLPDTARLTVTDLNPPMLDYAAARQRQDARIAWEVADALALPFADGAFDSVICQFGVMFFPDRVAGFAEARRVLRPGGRFLFNTWDRIEANAFAHVVTEVAGEIFPDHPPRFLARTPHGYHDVDRIRADLGGAGFTEIIITTLDEISRAGSARDPALAYCQGTPLRNEIETRDAALLDHVTERTTRAIAERFGPGPVAAPIRAHVVVARS